MKCPKCGFNSFEYFDSCKKCSSDLIGYKQTYSITPLVLPLVAKEQMAAEFRSAESASNENNDSVETHDDIFSFDLPEDSPPPSRMTDDPFNFDEPVSDIYQAAETKSDDVFADLLESTSQTDDSPFAAPEVKAPAAAQSAAPSSSPGEFDLDSFSWDDTTSTAPASDTAESPDDFDTLFGETKEKPE